MEGKPHSQLWDVYKKMSKFVKSRNYRQCKSYHQKQCIQFPTILDIINNLKETSPAILSSIENEREALVMFFGGKNEEKV